MKRITHNLMIYSLSALSCLAPCAFAESIAVIPIGEPAENDASKPIIENQYAFVPRFEKSIIASIGTFYAAPSSDLNNYYYSESADLQEFNLLTVDPSNEFGFDVALGYIFDNSANSIEAFFRDINTSDNASEDNISQGSNLDANASTNLDYHLRSADLMFGQYLNLGDAMQIRLAAGAAYAELKRDQTITNVDSDGNNLVNIDEYSKFTGFGPRLSADMRYAFDEGFGVIGSLSMAYFIGQLKNSYSFVDENESISVNDTNDDQGVMNFRGNIGLDYVYQIEDEAQTANIGIEIGYLIDYYDDSVRNINSFPEAGFPDPGADEYTSTVALSFAGPYVNLKAAF